MKKRMVKLKATPAEISRLLVGTNKQTGTDHHFTSTKTHGNWTKVINKSSNTEKTYVQFCKWTYYVFPPSPSSLWHTLVANFDVRFIVSSRRIHHPPRAVPVLHVCRGQYFVKIALKNSLRDIYTPATSPQPLSTPTSSLWVKWTSVNLAPCVCTSRHLSHVL